jgi:type II secretory pathway component PulJ
MKAFTPPPRPERSRALRGFGLIEILLTLSFGLLLVAAIGSWSVAHIGEQRRLLAQARLSQDLRAGADLVARDLRRAGHWGHAERGVWTGGDTAPAPNPYAGLHPGAGTPSTSLGHAYSREADDNGVLDGNERYGLRLNPANGALEWRVAGAALAPGAGDQWQALTDPAALQVTQLLIRHEVDSLDLLGHCAQAACPTPAAPAAPACPPRLLLHRVTITLEGRDARDATLRRGLRETLRLRNEEVQGACPAG